MISFARHGNFFNKVKNYRSKLFFVSVSDQKLNEEAKVVEGNKNSC